MLGFVSVVVGVATLLITAGNASAQIGSAGARVAPVWGVALDGRQANQPNLELLAQAKAAGVNAIVTDPKRWSTERHRRLASLARGLGMFLIEPRRPSKGGGNSSELRAQCRSGLRDHRPCAFVAKSTREAVELARRGTVDYVVVRLASPNDLKLVNVKRSTRTQVITVLTVGESANLDTGWDQAIDSAVQNQKTTLATGLSGAFAATAIRDYFGLLEKHNAGAPTFGQRQGNVGNGSSRDRLPPTAPLAATVVSATSTSVVLKWTASTDNVGLAGYGIYLSGTSIGSTAATTFAVNGLQCGSIYSFAIDAYDRRRNRSQKVAVTGATSSCPLPPPAAQPAPSPSTPSAPDASDRSRPTRPDGLAASGTTQSSMTLSWRPSADNVGVAGYEIFNGSQSVGTTTSNAYLVTRLSCGTTYQFAVRAYDAAGNTSRPATITMATTACSPSPDTQAPTVPGTLRLVSTAGSSITLAWAPSSDNVGVAGYGIYRGSDLAGSTNSTSYTVAGLACSTSYTLAVDAYDAAGNHSQRASITTSTSSCPPAADTQAPTVPSNVRATGATPTSITVGWIPSTDNVGVTGYTVYTGSSAAGNTTSTSYTVVGLSCGATYTLAVDAFDVAGNRSSKASVNATTSACPQPPPPPPPPVDHQPVAAFTYSPQNAVTGSPVSFNASTSTCADTPCSYAWEDDGPDGSGGTEWPLGTGQQLSFTFQGAGTKYVRLNVTDVDGDKATTMTPLSVATTAPPPSPQAPDIQAPTVPGGLHVTAATANSITVAWTASTDNVGVAGYGLYRGGTSTGTTPSTSATFSGLVCGSGYTLAVDAYDAAGNRSSQASMSAPTSACPPTPPTPDAQAPTVPSGLHATAATASSITVAWTASTDNVGVSGYGLYRNSASTGTTASLSATFSGLSCGAGYTLAVDAYDAVGNRSAKASITASTSACPPPADTQPPTVPGGLRVTAATATSIALAWTASTDNVAVTGYGVYNGASNVGSTAPTSYTVSSLSCGTGYTLAVDAYDAAGNHSGKASLTASTSACSPPPPPPSAANLYISPSGSDSNPCTQAAPCKSPTRAYRLASRGQTVQVAGGTYSGIAEPLMSYDAAKDSGSGVVTFVPSGAVVFPNPQSNFNGVRHVKFDATGGGSFTFNIADFAYSGSSGTLDVVMDGGAGRNVHFKSVNSGTSAPSPKPSFAILNSEIGPNNGVSEDLIHLRNTQDTLFQGNFVHDVTVPAPGAHTECTQEMGSSVNLSLIGNTFQRCWGDAAFIKADFGAIVNFKFNNNRILDPINGDGGTPYAVGVCGALGGGCNVSNVSGEIRNNCILATAFNHIIVDNVAVDGGTQTITLGGDNVAVSGNRYGGC